MLRFDRWVLYRDGVAALSADKHSRVGFATVCYSCKICARIPVVHRPSAFGLRHSCMLVVSKDVGLLLYTSGMKRISGEAAA